MSSRIRIPGLVDVIRLDEPAAIRSIVADPRLDRDFKKEGPLINRLLAGRIRKVLRVGSHPLPAVAPREAEDRARLQALLEQRLQNAQLGTPEQRATLAAYVRGEKGEGVLGPTAQAAVGELFAPGYAARKDRWQAARTLDAAPRSFNPLQILWWGLTGAVDRARKTLAAPVDNDPAAVHATGVAVHNLVRGLKIMRGLWRQPFARESLTEEAVICQCAVAPANVLRQWKAPASTLWGEVEPGAITLFQLDAARYRSPSHQIVFMTDSWSRCPAHHWTASLLGAVWREAKASAPVKGGRS
ncbi:hypothetical protein DMC25_01885 [Caulobacter sp. D4A]|uniref:hypothetical protein n=1 Tax=unclassified Caulobacter TaxID=2648921 RepID=UPI000D72978C|nr:MULTISPECIES: hypothetical protein [unclassified Caulobacter]PXA89527.1 hypothetical protein DMC18_16760 [Caulobacter sp. D5]PXA94741.1 hypothetical protein DMC25_01885 [Caulobacter sp. D4A]